ncbi:hypothetical protein INR49_026579 [Caranx melampygus]|nr:hypothetical protein INR49_026579 [Caranx melampygus]
MYINTFASSATECNAEVLSTRVLTNHPLVVTSRYSSPDPDVLLDTGEPSPDEDDVRLTPFVIPAPGRITGLTIQLR